MFKWYEFGCFGLCILVIIGMIVGFSVINLGHKQTLEATVVDTFIDEGNTYFVLQSINTGEKFACENKDSLWYGKWNSNDFIVDIEIDNTYQFFLVGYRVPFLSSFPNIISYKYKGE